jgi:hypothetical protein
LINTDGSFGNCLYNLKPILVAETSPSPQGESLSRNSIAGGWGEVKPGIKRSTSITKTITITSIKFQFFPPYRLPGYQSKHTIKKPSVSRRMAMALLKLDNILSYCLMNFLISVKLFP